MVRFAFVLIACLSAALLLGLHTGSLPAEGPKAASPFAVFVDDYFDAYFARKPSEGTAAGLHSTTTSSKTARPTPSDSGIEAVKRAPGPTGQAPGR